MEQKTIQEYFHILGLKPGASLADVKEAYKFLVQTFHEDKYPQGHPHKEKAHLKMVELNEAYAELKLFFEQNPTGVPEGGWPDPSKEASSPEGSQPHAHSNSNDAGDSDLDWKSWQEQQQSDWQSELNQWHEADSKRRSQLRKEEEKKKRQVLVNTSRIALALAVLCMYLGHESDQKMRESTNRMNEEIYRARLQYDLATHGTGNGPYVMSNREIYQQDMPDMWLQHAKSVRDHEDNSTSSLLLLGFGGFLTWMFVSNKGKNLLNNYVDGKPFKRC